MADFHDHDDEAMALDFAGDAIGADAAAPKAGHRPFESFASLTGIVKCKHAVLRIESDAALNGQIELCSARSAARSNSIVQAEPPLDLLERDAPLALALFEDPNGVQIVGPVFKISDDGFADVVALAAPGFA
jgi:hypothetical protein